MSCVPALFAVAVARENPNQTVAPVRLRPKMYTVLPPDIDPESGNITHLNPKGITVQEPGQ